MGRSIGYRQLASDGTSREGGRRRCLLFLVTLAALAVVGLGGDGGAAKRPGLMHQVMKPRKLSAQQQKGMEWPFKFQAVRTPDPTVDGRTFLWSPEVSHAVDRMYRGMPGQRGAARFADFHMHAFARAGSVNPRLKALVRRVQQTRQEQRPRSELLRAPYHRYSINPRTAKWGYCSAALISIASLTRQITPTPHLPPPPPPPPRPSPRPPPPKPPPPPSPPRRRRDVLRSRARNRASTARLSQQANMAGGESLPRKRSIE
jgi:hypothetical protein